METENKLDERIGWGYFWINSEWKLQFLVLSPGSLKIYLSDKRTSIEKNLCLSRCVSELHKPFHVMESKHPKYLLKKRAWKCLMKLAASDEILSHSDATVITVKPRRDKTCFLLFTSQAEAETWKAGIHEATNLYSAATANKDPKKSWKRNKALQQASDVLDQTRMFFQSKSLLKPPFGLRWEAYPPLFKILASQPPTSPTVLQEKIDNSSTTDDRTNVPDSNLEKPIWSDLTTLSGCTNFLRSSYLNVSALQQASTMVNHFKGSYQMGDSSLPNELRLEAWKGTIQRIVKALVDGILSNNPSMGPCNSDEELMDLLYSASEIWVFGAVHDKIMCACKQMFAVEDTLMDTILSKLEKVDPAKLGVRPEFEMFVLGEALDEFRMLNRLRTPFEKALCLQKTVKCIVDGINSLVKSCTGGLEDKEGLLPCTDDLLSFMLLLMARAKVKYLHANACYMENFIVLQKDTNRGELLYHITNFHAACNFLQSQEVQELIGDITFSSKDSPSPVRQARYSVDASSSSSSSLLKSTSSNTDEGNSTTHTTMASSRNDSLDSDANYRSKDNTRWEDVSEKSSLDRDDWRNNDSLNDGDFSELHGIECPIDERKFWWANVEENNHGLFLHTGKNGVFGIPGNSPDFLLASTYQ